MDTLKKQQGTSPVGGVATEIESANSGSRQSVGEVFFLSENRDTNQSAQFANQEGVPGPARKRGGPKTQQGKLKSKRNALKHGIFSRVVLLPWEPRAELASLHSGLRDCYEPEGKLEELLVDKLAAVAWRERRAIIAEGAEIRKGTEFLESEEEQYQDAEATGNLLEELRTSIETNGFVEQNDNAILARLCGQPGVDAGAKKPRLLDLYSRCLKMAQSNASGEDSESPTPEDCAASFVACLNQGIQYCKRYIESQRMMLKSLRGNVTYPAQLDHLTRYEANLERAFDRTLNQLERLQRIRKGQPVLPPLNVNVSA